MRYFKSAGKVRSITGGDGVACRILEMPGSYGGRNGVFQFIKEADGAIKHGCFIVSFTRILSKGTF